MEAHTDNLPGESLGNVHYAMDYLRNPDVYRLGKSLLVVGAGNVAMDVARTALRHSCEAVTILSSRGESTVSARMKRQYALIDGAKLLMNKTVVRFTIEGAVLADTDLTRTDGLFPIPGRRSPSHRFRHNRHWAGATIDHRILHHWHHHYRKRAGGSGRLWSNQPRRCFLRATW